MDGIQTLTSASNPLISISSLTSGGVNNRRAPDPIPPTPPVIVSPLSVPYVAPIVPAPTIITTSGSGLSVAVIPNAVGTPISGSIPPNLTMQNVNQPYFIPFSYLSSLQKQDPFTVSTLNANVVNVSTLNAMSSFTVESYTVSSFNQNVLTDYIEATEAYVYDKLTLDNQVLTANATDLLLNGIPIATTSNLSSIADWSLDPAISTIRADGNDLTNVRFANFSSIIADGLTVVKLTTLFSTTIEVFESTITSETQKLTVSSITGGNGSFDILTANTFINPASSTINCQFLNVSSNANIQTATFSNGANFNGTRPNFNTGINTSGANNFNFTNIDNASNINGNVITIAPQNNLNINTSNAVATVVDRGADVGGSAVIGLTARFGGGSQINLNANSASILALTPTSAINLDAQGNVGATSGIPFGGAINLTARAGLSGAGASVAGGGGINLTAFSYGGIAPGTIKESAGSILSYSGLTVPSVGVLGSGFYSALNCLSLTAGASPATTSFPGVVYLRGDNGTKVDNGFFPDTITATGNSVLPTITGVTTINGVAYPPPSAPSSWVSTATTALNMNSNIIFDVGEYLSFKLGSYLRSYTPGGFTNAFLDINGNSGDSQLRLINGTSEVALRANSDLGITPTAGYRIVLNSPTTYAGTAVIGTPSAFGNTFAYFGNNSLAANGTEYALLQENNGRTFLNAKTGTDIRFRINNADVMSMDAGNLSLNNNSIANVANIGSSGNMNINTLSTNQISINQTSGSDFTLFNNGDTRMRAVRNAYVDAVENVFLNGTTGVSMNNGGAQISIAGDNNIYFTGNGAGFKAASFQETSVVFNSSTPGSLTMYMNGNNIINVDNLTRNLGAAVVRTPVIQYGTVTTSGGSGSIVVNIPNAYTSATSYIALVSMEDATPAEMSVVRINASRIEIYWANGGGGAHTIAWSCQGE